MSQIKLDDDLLKELGLDKFDEPEKEAMLSRIYEALQLRVGMRIAKLVSEEQLSAFEQLTKSGKNDEAAAWLKQHVPQYQQIATEELEAIKKDVLDTSRKVLEKSI